MNLLFSLGLDKFRKILEAVKAIGEVAAFEVNDDLARIREIDSWNVALVDCVLPKQCFIHYECPSKSFFGLNVTKILPILKKFKGGLVELSVEDKAQLKVLPEGRPRNTRIFKFPVEKINQDDLPLDINEKEFKFSHEVEVSSKAFLEALKHVEKIDDYVKLTVKSEELVFEAGDEEDIAAKIVIADPEDLTKVKTSVKGYAAAAKYNLKYLLETAKTATKLAKLMKLKLATDYPICLQLDFPTNGVTKYWIAPYSG